MGADGRWVEGVGGGGTRTWRQTGRRCKVCDPRAALVRIYIRYGRATTSSADQDGWRLHRIEVAEQASSASTVSTFRHLTHTPVNCAPWHACVVVVKQWHLSQPHAHTRHTPVFWAAQHARFVVLPTRQAHVHTVGLLRGRKGRPQAKGA